MAVRASREVLIDAAPEAILDALADLDSVPSWSPLHKRIEVLDKYDDGRPHHVKVQYRIMGITDKELLEYHWGRDWMVWDADETFQQHAQHVNGMARDGEIGLGFRRRPEVHQAKLYLGLGAQRKHEERE